MATPDMATKGQWEEYVAAYHKFWDYLEQHEELLQWKGSVNSANVIKVCDIMEECPVVNFSCVRDLIYTMRQFLGEKRFREQEEKWRKRLRLKVEECIQSIGSEDESEGDSEDESEGDSEDESEGDSQNESEGDSEDEIEDEDEEASSEEEEVDLAIEVNPTCNFLQKHRLTGRVQKKFTRRLERLSKLQCHLRSLSLRKYKRQVYGQDIFRQQGLILNFNILRTFYNNAKKYFELEPRQCRKLLRRITEEALDPEGMCIQAAHWYAPDWYKGQLLPSKDTLQTLTQICDLLRRLHQEAVHPRAGCIQAAHLYIGAHGEETLQKFTRISIWPLHEPVVSSYGDRKEALSKRFKDNDKPKSDIPPIYIPHITTRGEVSFQKSIPLEIAKSKHFKRVKKIIKSEKYRLCHDVTDPAKKSNWVYYIVVKDPTVYPEAANQGYIGMTTQPLKTRMKQHARGEDMIIHYNLALISQFAHQRGEDLSDYVAVFALGTTPDRTLCKEVEGVLIRESLEDCSVTNMKFGMNSK